MSLFPVLSTNPDIFTREADGNDCEVLLERVVNSLLHLWKTQDRNPVMPVCSQRIVKYQKFWDLWFYFGIQKWRTSVLASSCYRIMGQTSRNLDHLELLDL